MANITLYSLSDYNAGNLIPFSIDLDSVDSREEYLEIIAVNLKGIDKEQGNDIYIPKREEWIVSDYEGIPGNFVGEYDIDASYWDVKEFMSTTYLDLEVILTGIDCDISLENIEEAYCGQHDCDKDFVEQMIDDCGDLPDLPSFIHIDWTSTARDVMMDYSEHDGHYFRNF